MKRGLPFGFLVLIAAAWTLWPARKTPETAAPPIKIERSEGAASPATPPAPILPPIPIFATVPPAPPPPPTLQALSGRVTDEHGAAIAGAFVGSTAPGSDAVITDVLGAFTLHEIPDGMVKIYAGAPGYTDAHRVLPLGVRHAELTLRREAVVRVRLSGPAAVELLASVCRPASAARAAPFCVARVVVPEGHQELAFTRLPAGEHELWFEAGEKVLRKLPIETHAGSELALHDVEIPLHPAAFDGAL